MQKLNTLWQLVGAASTVRDITQHRKVYHFAASEALTFYLQAENADVEIIRWARPAIELTVHLAGAFGWRVATDQDAVGVYVAAQRRLVVGGLSSARFEVRCPDHTYVVVKLDGGALRLTNISGTIQVPPSDSQGVMMLESGDSPNS